MDDITRKKNRDRRRKWLENPENRKKDREASKLRMRKLNQDRAIAALLDL